jgi:hypothetical protein
MGIIRIILHHITTVEYTHRWDLAIMAEAAIMAATVSWDMVDTADLRTDSATADSAMAGTGDAAKYLLPLDAVF